MPTDAERWGELLTVYEQHLDAQEAFLGVASRPAGDIDLLDETPPAAFVVPHGFPAAPPHLLERLAELHERTLALTARTSDVLDSLERPSAPRRTSARETTVATMLDRAL